ncbi:M23 family metallopeptidase [Micromonospora sp. C28ISP2-4]|uniref:M23 family metallopeptidase n=1 Tax=Micromonospora sp. C28ISP2-4 TaxID=3059523 RepID=UPI0026746748|nr:M23 family metallopeptidase [Micromonospora sp. C28ISP2-4]MDO3683435.1 M23 family metallopeptidase [Micromonospora sp. C28ISP2-4]
MEVGHSPPPRIDRRHLLGVITAALAGGILPEAWLAEAAYGATPRWNRPFDKWVPITSSFGSRTDPITGQTKYHAGTDYSYSGILGYPVRSIAAGTVTSVGYNASGYGNYAVVTHADGWESLYGHMGRTCTLRYSGPTANWSTRSRSSRAHPTPGHPDLPQKFSPRTD